MMIVQFSKKAEKHFTIKMYLKEITNYNSIQLNSADTERSYFYR